MDNFLPSEIYPETQSQPVKGLQGHYQGIQNPQGRQQVGISLLFKTFLSAASWSIFLQWRGDTIGQRLQTPAPFTCALRMCTHPAPAALTFTDSSSMRRRLFSDRRSLFLDSVCCSWVSSSASYSRLPSWNSRNSSCVFSALERNCSNRTHHHEQWKNITCILKVKTTLLLNTEGYISSSKIHNQQEERYMQMFSAMHGKSPHSKLVNK